MEGRSGPVALFPCIQALRLMFGLGTLICRPAAQGRGPAPAIALTAYARPEDHLRALQAGYQAHMSKPVELSELVVVIARLACRVGRGAANDSQADEPIFTSSLLQALADQMSDAETGAAGPTLAGRHSPTLVNNTATVWEEDYY
jgi:CheY-like chemotaxis protein